ncbi:SOS response-associated peptidase [Mucilaginibacter defluvii]
MCGRTLVSESKELAKKAGVEEGGTAQEKDNNRPPGSEMPVILDARPGKLHYVRWGLIPNNATEKPKYSTTYAKVETMQSLPTYRNLVGKRHCVFVIEGFYEWYRSGENKKPFFFQRKDKGLIYCAGLWDTWKDPATGIVIPSCTMLMQPANDFMLAIHDRMPCILTQAEASTWLDKSLNVIDRLKVLKAVPNDLLEGWPVDQKMNNFRVKDDNNNSPCGPDLTLFD